MREQKPRDTKLRRQRTTQHRSTARNSGSRTHGEEETSIIFKSPPTTTTLRERYVRGLVVVALNPKPEYKKKPWKETKRTAPREQETPRDYRPSLLFDWRRFKNQPRNVVERRNQSKKG